MANNLNVAVVGATGAVGEAMIGILEQRSFPVGRLFPLASERSAGSTINFKGKSIEVKRLDEFDFSSIDVGLFSAGATLKGTLSMVRDFRLEDSQTPIILMGYFNPIYRYGSRKFVNDAYSSGVDGLIIVDLPPEEDEELCHPALTAGLHWIRLVTPTTHHKRLISVLQNTSGFVYYVSITGITGTHSADPETLKSAITQLRKVTDLPLAVGFGIKSSEQVHTVNEFAEAAVVGSALVNKIRANLDESGRPKADLCDNVIEFVQDLARGTALT